MEAASPAAKTRFTVPVVCRALVRIAQDVVRLRDLLELFLRLARPVVAIGVKLHRELAVGLLDLVIGRCLRDTENGVIVGHGMLWRSEERRVGKDWVCGTSYERA